MEESFLCQFMRTWLEAKTSRTLLASNDQTSKRGRANVSGRKRKNGHWSGSRALTRCAELFIESHFVSWWSFWPSFLCIFDVQPWNHWDYFPFIIFSFHFLPSSIHAIHSLKAHIFTKFPKSSCVSSIEKLTTQLFLTNNWENWKPTLGVP